MAKELSKKNLEFEQEKQERQRLQEILKNLEKNTMEGGKN